MPTQKTSISLDPELIRYAKQQAKARGFKYSFSGFIAMLIAEDKARLDANQGKPAPHPSRKLPVRQNS